MSRYRLNIRDNGVLQTSQAETLRDLKAARIEASLCARRYIEKVRPDKQIVNRMYFEITDCAGKVLLIMPFVEAWNNGDSTKPRRWWWRRAIR